MSTKVIISSLIGAGAIGGVATGSYYLLKSETPKEESTKITTPKTLLQELAGNDFEALNTDSDSSEHNTEWGNLITKHLESSYTKVAKIENIGIATATDNNVGNIKKLKAECKRILSKTSDFEADKVTAKNWCNKKSKVITEA